MDTIYGNAIYSSIGLSRSRRKFELLGDFDGNTYAIENKRKAELRCFYAIVTPPSITMT
jgi:hypothetical protein